MSDAHKHVITCDSHSVTTHRVSLTLCGHIKTAKQRTITQQYGDRYTLAVDGWVVTNGTAKRGLGGLRPYPVPYSLYKM